MHISPLLGMCPFHMSLPQCEQSSRLGSEILASQLQWDTLLWVGLLPNFVSFL